MRNYMHQKERDQNAQIFTGPSLLATLEIARSELGVETLEEVGFSFEKDDYRTGADQVIVYAWAVEIDEAVLQGRNAIIQALQKLELEGSVAIVQEEEQTIFKVSGDAGNELAKNHRAREAFENWLQASKGDSLRVAFVGRRERSDRGDRGDRGDRRDRGDRGDRTMGGRRGGNDRSRGRGERRSERSRDPERERFVIAQAEQAIEEALRTHEAVALPPMNSYERRLVHQRVQEEEGLQSRSIGQDSDRSVEIVPR